MSKVLFHQLAGARGSLTKTYNKIVDAQKNKDFSNSDVTIWKNTLIAQNDRIKELNKKVEEVLEDSEDKLEAESEKIEEYYTKAFEGVAIADMLINESASGSYSQEKAIRLPKIELPKFDGNVLLWQEFFETFTVTVDQQNISEIEKFQYLKGSLKGEAAATITGMPVTHSNYSAALEILKNRYGSTKRVLRAHVRSLLALSTPNIKSSASLRSFIDSIHRHMRGLEGLDVVQDNYEIFLCEILLIKVPNDIKHEWARLHEDKMNLKELITILENEAKHQEIISSTKSDLLSSSHSPQINTPMKLHNTNRTLVVQGTCPFCDSGDHSAFSCKKLLDLQPKMRLNLVRTHKLCVNCLRTHNVQDCASQSRCKKCSAKHNTLLHFGSANGSKSINKEDTKSCIAQSQKNTILPTITVPMFGKKGIISVGILLDSGSDRSFVSSRISAALQAKVIGRENLNIKSFNGPSVAETCPILAANILLSDESTLPINLLVSKNMNHMTNHAAVPVNAHQDFPHLHICKPAAQIDVIIGSDNFYKVATGNIHHVNNNLKLIETIFGWTYHGFIRSSATNLQKAQVLFTTCGTVDDSFDVKMFWDDQLAGILPKTEDTDQNQLVTRFIDNIRFSDNRYEVNFPWSNKSTCLLSYRKQALARLHYTTKKLNQTHILQDYHNILMDYKSKGIIEECIDTPVDNVRYIPHHPVVKESSISTKIRIVFDASACDHNNQSINNCLFEGTNLFPDIVGILLRFRLHQFAFTGDIEKAFLQISINAKDRNFTRFLWYEDALHTLNKIKEYRFCRVPFGFRSSPFILNQVIQTHLNHCEPLYPDTVKQIQGNIYVDDLIISTESHSSLSRLVNEAKAIFSSMSMNMHKLHSNAPDFQNESSNCKILGIQWNIKLDNLNISVPSNTSITTKRQLASFLCSVFDPLGLYLPFINNLKSLLHKCWLLKLEWDEPLPVEITSLLLDFEHDVQQLSKHMFSRWFLFDSSCKNVELHAFADASLEMYCAAVYLVFNRDGKQVSNLLCAKSRLAPKRQANTVPRLELLAALITSRLVHKVSSLLSNQVKFSVRCFSDSQVVLHWIKSESANKQSLIQRKVDEIKSLYPPHHWSYVRSRCNPADLGTRTTKLKTWLHNDLWWHGPSVSDLAPECNSDGLDSGKMAHQETETSVLELPTHIDPSAQIVESVFDISRFSSYQSLLRTVSFILKFCKLDKSPEVLCIATMQRESFQSEILALQSGENISKKSSLCQLQPFLDKNKILRVGGRLKESDMNFDMMHPIILDRNHHLTQLIIKWIHMQNSHAGLSTLTNLTRQRFWIPQCRRTCKKVIAKCVRCQRYSAKPYMETFDQLPQERIRSFSMRPFQYVGIDYLGPICTLSNGNKVYILLFTCMQVRAVHLEVTLSLAYDEFCNAFSRFTSRRGFPSQVRSDNAKTFKSAANKLSSAFNFVWKFNHERAPWEGGCWERLVRSVKTALRQSMSSIRPLFQDLVTLVCHVESIVNHRPITYCTGNETDVLPLSPINFLIPSASLSTTAEITSQAAILRRALSCNNLAVARFWRRWKADFLTSLNCNNGKSAKYPLQIGDIMLLNEAPKRQHWPLVRIVDLIPGRDGKVRSARIRYKGKVFVRPLKLLHRLELSDS